MINLAVILAADLPAAQPTRVPRLVASDLVVILGLAGLIFAFFIAYLIFIRGSKSDIQGPRRIHSESASSDESNNGHRRKRKRVRRRDHRQRNPTLSQTGGLPPPRDPQESSSPLG